MKIYLLLAEEPFYTKSVIKKIIHEFPGEIVGVGFPIGFINMNRIVKSFFIYGPIKFVKVG